MCVAPLKEFCSGSEVGPKRVLRGPRARSPRFEVRLEVRRGEVKLRDSRSESEVRGLMSEIGSRLKVKVPGSRSVKILPGIALRDQYGQTASGGSIPCWFTVSLKW